jgi:hypothetical protein
MLANVQQKSTRAIIRAIVTKGSWRHTDAYKIYDRLPLPAPERPAQQRRLGPPRPWNPVPRTGDGFSDIRTSAKFAADAARSSPSEASASIG